MANGDAGALGAGWITAPVRARDLLESGRLEGRWIITALYAGRRLTVQREPRQFAI